MRPKPYRKLFAAVLDAHPHLCRDTQHLAQHWPVCELGGQPSAYPTLLLGMLEIVRAAHPSSMPSLGKDATQLSQRLERLSKALDPDDQVLFIHNVLMEHLKLCIGLGQRIHPLRDVGAYQSAPYKTMVLSVKSPALEQYYQTLQEAHHLLVQLAAVDVEDHATTTKAVGPKRRDETGYYVGSALVPYVDPAVAAAVATTTSPFLATILKSTGTGILLTGMTYAVHAIWNMKPFRILRPWDELQVITEAMQLYDQEWTTAVPPDLYYVRSVPFTHPHSPAVTTALMHEALTESLLDIAQKYGERNAQMLWTANQIFAPRFFQYTGSCEEAANIPGIKYYYGRDRCSVTKDTYFHPVAITPESARAGFHTLLRLKDFRIDLEGEDVPMSEQRVSPEYLVDGYKWILNHFTRVSWDQVLHQQYTQLEAVFDEAAEDDIIMMANPGPAQSTGSESYFGAHLLLMCKQLLLHHRDKRLHFYSQDSFFDLAHTKFLKWSQAHPPRWVQDHTRIHLIYMNDGDYSGHQLAEVISGPASAGLLLPPHVRDRVHLVAISALHTSLVPRRLLGQSVDYRGGERVELVQEMMEREQLPRHLRDAVSALLQGEITKPLAYLDFKIPDSVSIPRFVGFIIDGDKVAFYRAHEERRALPHDQTLFVPIG